MPGIRFSVRDCLQHAPRTGAEEVGDEARQLDVGFLQQTLQAVLQLDSIARELILAARHRPPESLFHLRHKAQDEFLCDQPLH